MSGQVEKAKPIFCVLPKDQNGTFSIIQCSTLESYSQHFPKAAGNGILEPERTDSFVSLGKRWVHE
jgi:hypothetical protein